MTTKFDCGTYLENLKVYVIHIFGALNDVKECNSEIEKFIEFIQEECVKEKLDEIAAKNSEINPQSASPTNGIEFSSYENSLHKMIDGEMAESIKKAFKCVIRFINASGNDTAQKESSKKDYTYRNCLDYTLYLLSPQGRSEAEGKGIAKTIYDETFDNYYLYADKAHPVSSFSYYCSDIIYDQSFLDMIRTSIYLPLFHTVSAVFLLELYFEWGINPELKKLRSGKYCKVDVKYYYNDHNDPTPKKVRVVSANWEKGLNDYIGHSGLIKNRNPRTNWNLNRILYGIPYVYLNCLFGFLPDNLVFPGEDKLVKKIEEKIRIDEIAKDNKFIYGLLLYCSEMKRHLFFGFNKSAEFLQGFNNAWKRLSYSESTEWGKDQIEKDFPDIAGTVEMEFWDKIMKATSRDISVGKRIDEYIAKVYGNLFSYDKLDRREQELFSSLDDRLPSYQICSGEDRMTAFRKQISHEILVKSQDVTISPVTCIACPPGESEPLKFNNDAYTFAHTIKMGNLYLDPETRNIEAFFKTGLFNPLTLCRIWCTHIISSMRSFIDAMLFQRPDPPDEDLTFDKSFYDNLSSLEDRNNLKINWGDPLSDLLVAKGKMLSLLKGPIKKALKSVIVEDLEGKEANIPKALEGQMPEALKSIIKEVWQSKEVLVSEEDFVRKVGEVYERMFEGSIRYLIANQSEKMKVDPLNRFHYNIRTYYLKFLGMLDNYIYAIQENHIPELEELQAQLVDMITLASYDYEFAQKIAEVYYHQALKKLGQEVSYLHRAWIKIKERFLVDEESDKEHDFKGFMKKIDEDKEHDFWKLDEDQIKRLVKKFIIELYGKIFSGEKVTGVTSSNFQSINPGYSLINYWEGITFILLSYSTQNAFDGLTARFSLNRETYRKSKKAFISDFFEGAHTFVKEKVLDGKTLKEKFEESIKNHREPRSDTNVTDSEREKYKEIFQYQYLKYIGATLAFRLYPEIFYGTNIPADSEKRFLSYDEYCSHMFANPVLSYLGYCQEAEELEPNVDMEEAFYNLRSLSAIELYITLAGNLDSSFKSYNRLTIPSPEDIRDIAKHFGFAFTQMGLEEDISYYDKFKLMFFIVMANVKENGNKRKSGAIERYISKNRQQALESCQNSSGAEIPTEKDFIQEVFHNYAGASGADNPRNLKDFLEVMEKGGVGYLPKPAYCYSMYSEESIFLLRIISSFMKVDLIKIKQ